jgi:DUF4097 and DUF4098 domain-containing protein YvlB
MNPSDMGEDEMTRHTSRLKMVLVFSVLSLLTMGGCLVVQSGGWGQAKYERTVSQQTPRDAIASLDVETDNGAIRITGAEVDEFAVTAQIVGYAPTDEEAQKLAEQTDVRCEQTDSALTIRANQPEPQNRNNRFVNVSYTITVPRQMSLHCRSRYGSVDVTGVEAAVDAKTSNGSIKIENVRGDIHLDTSYGAIVCTDAAGHVVTLRSSNGRIDLTTATFGKCDIDTSYGAIACNGLKGNSVRLHSNNGSIELASSQVNTVSLSSSYGAIRATDISTADLKAESGNGSIEIDCSPDCPSDLKADVTSSYGSIRFAAPPQFAGQVRLSTSYGTVRTARPVTIPGEIDKKNISGTVGEGTGTIHLATNNGSVDLQ